MEPGEWEDASALTGFWYDYAQNDFRYLAPPQTQVQVYFAYDNEHLYVAYDSPVYPESSWMKARGRFPDVLGHPLYGIQWDDHIEVEFRPFADNTKGFEHGLFRFYVNPINTLTDYYWSLTDGELMKWNSGTKVRSNADGKRWVIEMAIPLTALVYGGYAGTDGDGQPRVVLPPPDGTVYRAWFTRGIGGNGAFFNVFDQHAWNTTKTRIVFDSQAPSFQINDLGPVMDDIIDLKLTVKNHSPRSQTVRIGFFVEGPEGLIYSSYDAAELEEGMVELRPGEVKNLRLRQPMPGVAQDGNVLWFDVRSAGTPAKSLFRTRLIRFHSMDGGIVNGVSFVERRVDIIAKLRPPREDFAFRWQFSPYTRKVFVALDKGIHGASEEARTAVEARISVLKTNLDEDVIHTATVPFTGDHAVNLATLEGLVPGESYQLNVLLFDASKRIVGERNPPPFSYERPEWMENQLGRDDVVWEPFTPIRGDTGGFDTLKHRFDVGPSGLPTQITIKPDARELPLEQRAKPDQVDAATLATISRGPQLRQPMRIEAVIAGQRVAARVTKPARVSRDGASERVYTAALDAGPVTIDLTTRYDCDGSMHAEFTYRGDGTTAIESLELVSEFTGTFDLYSTAIRGGSMAGSDQWDCRLPAGEGVVWHSAMGPAAELFYSRFVPWIWFGNGDRGFTWFADSDQGWLLDRERETMSLERDAKGALTWRVRFVNESRPVGPDRHIAFSILTHPAKPKPADFRTTAWHLQGPVAIGYQSEHYDVPEETLLKEWRAAAGAPKDTPDDQRTSFRKDEPIWRRYGFWRNVQMRTPELDQTFEDKAMWYFERKIRIGRRVGGWMDEYWPIYRSMNVAAGNAYLRDPAEVREGELPWQDQFLTSNMRNFYKRMARVHQSNNVPNRNATWANNASTMLESFIWDAMLVEECGAGHRSYDVDVVTQFPDSLYRYITKGWSGVIVRIQADDNPVVAGDDKRFERQWLGRALLHDVGVNLQGPHGRFHHPEQGLRLLGGLDRFGFFRDTEVERLPYWRNAGIVSWGDSGRTHVTVYRRLLPDGAGCQALFVLMNESDTAVELPLTIHNLNRVLGGANTLTLAEARARQTADPALAKWWSTAAAAFDGGTAALIDLETGEAVTATPGEAATYGPVAVPYHDFRVLFAEFRR